MVPGKSWEEKFKNLERYGFEGIEIRLNEEVDLNKEIRKIQRASQNSSVKVCSAFVASKATRYPLTTKKMQRAKLDSAKRNIDIATVFGALTPFIPEYRSQNLSIFESPRKPTPLEEQLLTELLEEVGAYAEKLNCCVVIEPLNRYETHFFHTVEEVIQFFQGTQQKSFKVLLDLFHMNIEEKDIISSIKKAGSLIGHIHLADSNRWLPGCGHIDFCSVFESLKTVDYEGYMALECRIVGKPQDELPKCTAYLRTCMQK